MKIKIPRISPLLAEETGWHIGDGSMNFYHQKGGLKGIYQLRGHIEDDKKHYIERIKPIFEELYGIKISLREMPSTRVFGFQVWNTELVKFKEKLGLPLGKKFDISIPKVFTQDKDLIVSVIRGIFDTDGSINLEKKNNKLYPRIYITTICSTLAKQLYKLVNHLGLRTTLYSELYDKKFNRQQTFRLTIRGVKMFREFMEIIAPKNPKHFSKYQNFINSKSL